MSLILDALKKAERERQTETPPGLSSVHGKLPRAKKKNTLNLLLSMCILSLIVIGMFGYFFYPNKEIVRETTAPKSMVPETLIHESPPEPGLSSNDSVMITAPPQIAPLISNPDFPPATSKENQSLQVKASKGNVPGKNIQNFEDLPPDIKRKVPELVFAGHTYSQDPSQRMIIINNSIKREGDPIDPEMRLIEITWGGVVIEFEGSTFQIQAQ